MAALRHLVDDLGLDGVDVDYELMSQVPDLEHHCWTDADGVRRCYTDAELVEVVKRFRRWFPRPYLLSWAGVHVGCYGEPPFHRSAPAGGGWNGGYALALARDAEAAAALDHINIMTYVAPLRVRGLKRRHPSPTVSRAGRTLAGAWIETVRIPPGPEEARSHPCGCVD